MNFIVLMCDTFRRDHLGCYGATDVDTPSLNRLAAESVVFDQAFSCSFPTLPCRAEIFSGRFVFPYLDWGPLPRKIPLLSETLARAHYTCTMVTDNFQLCRPGYDYERGFHSRLRIRGQGYDPLAPADVPVRLPCEARKLKSPERLEQYLRNTALRRTEEDWFAPQVMTTAMQWLETHAHKGKFFLWVDCFDPHEPWDPPQEYVDRYDPAYAGDSIIIPNYGSAAPYTPAEMRHVRALYRGEVSMVDRWIGRLLDCLDALGRRDDTAVVMLSDHGIYLGDRGLIGKMEPRASEGGRPIGWPPLVELSAIPLLFRVPGLAPGRRQSFAHPGDLAPTILDLAGVPPPNTFRASSLRPVLEGAAPSVRDVAVSSWSFRGFNPRRPSVVRTAEWTLSVSRCDQRPSLYHRPTDPGEQRDVYAENRAAAREVHARYVAFLRSQGTPLRNLLPRLWQIPLTHPASPEAPVASEA